MFSCTSLAVFNEWHNASCWYLQFLWLVLLSFPATDFVFPVSCGEDFDFAKTPSAEALVKMQRLSPTEFVGTVQTPLLLALGAKDQRV